jgi:BMFP domain-containing protein YqiC
MAKLSERIANAAQTVNDAWRVRLQAWAREAAELERRVAALEADRSPSPPDAPDAGNQEAGR